MDIEQSDSSETIDIEKLGGDFADLEKDGKFHEILILAKQVNLPTRRESEALGAAITTLNQQHAELAEAGNPRWSLPHTGPGEMGGAGGLSGGAIGFIGGASRRGVRWVDRDGRRDRSQH